jgi:glycosyltransferase involved in cell wall biosynthesis
MTQDGSNAPLISVVLPTNNRAHLLGRAIHSVLAQTYRNLELLVVDDASTDDTAAVVTSISDRRLRYLRHDQNRGAAAARNLGIRESRGNLVAFQDDDDEWMVGKLERQVAALTAASPDVGLCLCGYMCYEPDRVRYIGGPQALAGSMDYAKGIRSESILIATVGWLVRKPLLEAAGLFDERMKTWEDWELALRLSQLCRFILVDEPLFIYNRVQGSGRWCNERAFGDAVMVIMEKHGAMWAERPAVRAHHYAIIGRIECQFDDLREGRRWLQRAIRTWPLSLRAWVALGFSFIGPSGLKAVTMAKRNGVRLLKLGHG